MLRTFHEALAARVPERTALPVITETLTAVVSREQPELTRSALEALAAFGPAAAPALPAVRMLATASDARVRPVAVTALWAIGRDREEVMPLLRDLLAGSGGRGGGRRNRRDRPARRDSADAIITPQGIPLATSGTTNPTNQEGLR